MKKIILYAKFANRSVEILKKSAIYNKLQYKDEWNTGAEIYSGTYKYLNKF
jgi:hypothetical protein